MTMMTRKRNLGNGFVSLVIRMVVTVNQLQSTPKTAVGTSRGASGKDSNSKGEGGCCVDVEEGDNIVWDVDGNGQLDVQSSDWDMLIDGSSTRPAAATATTSSELLKRFQTLEATVINTIK